MPVSAGLRDCSRRRIVVDDLGPDQFLKTPIVDRTGEVILPDTGPVSVAGLNYSQATATFKAAIAHVYKNFDLSVTMGRLHSIQIFVVGEARRPGSYTVSSLSTLVNAIFASGGPSLAWLNARHSVEARVTKPFAILIFTIYCSRRQIERCAVVAWRRHSDSIRGPPGRNRR